MLEKHLGKTFLLYLVVEILQLVHEINSFPEVLYKRGGLENFSKFTDKYKRQSSGTQQTFVGLQDVLKTSSTPFQRNNFLSSKTSSRHLARRVEDVFKTSSRRLTKNCYAEDVFKTCLEKVLKACLEDVMESNKMFTGDICI